MNQNKIITLDRQNIVYHFRRSRRAKRLLIKIGLAGEVEVVVPWWVSLKTTQRLVESRTEWIKQAINNNKNNLAQTPQLTTTTGSPWPIFGDIRQLVVNINPSRQRSRWQEQAGRIIIQTNRLEKVRPVLRHWYYVRAEKYFNRRAKVFASAVGVIYQTIAVSNARTQWGSCIPAKKRLSLNWRLALVPAYIAEYVIAHEVAHLKVGNHSPAFWSIVAKVQPNYRDCRRWLRKNRHYLAM